MAIEIKGLTDTYQVNVSTTGKQYYVVKMTTTADTVTLTTAAGERAYGVLQQPGSSNAYLPVMIYGISKVAHDGTLTPGLQWQCSTAGLATAASTEAGIYRLGTVLSAGSTVSGTLATVTILPNGQSTN